MPMPSKVVPSEYSASAMSSRGMAATAPAPSPRRISAVMRGFFPRASRIRLLYNIVPEAARYLADRPIEEIARSTEFNNQPDAICVSGLTAGSETDTQVLSRVKASVRHTPILCNTGCNKDNVVRQLTHSDGAVCATTFKYDGVFENAVDVARVKEFMDIVKEFRKTL